MSATEEVAKALTKIGEIVDLLVRPSGTSKQADAEAHHIRTVGEAEIEVAELKVQARRNAEIQEIRHQQNLEAITQQAKAVLEDRVQRKLLPEHAGEGQSDPDWFHKWAGYAKETSDQDLRVLWAKVLAGEVLQPGKFSLRLLQTISLLRKSDAENFSTFCNYVWRDLSDNRFLLYNDASWELLKKRLRVKNNDFDELRELGLVVNRGILHNLRAEQQDYLCYGGKAYSFLSGQVKGHSPVQIELTMLGKELMDLCEPVADPEYLLLLGGEIFCEVRPPPSPWPWPGVPPAS